MCLIIVLTEVFLLRVSPSGLGHGAARLDDLNRENIEYDKSPHC